MAEGYIPRSIEPLIVQVVSEHAAMLVTGPRQVGKLKNFKAPRKSSVPLGRDAIICADENVGALDSDVLVVVARPL